ncbi:condensation domain-containing protein, partial [Pseudoalteromonas ulvae]|uniref:condensation domain-containing protein n=1 Tax=Pseudoalteromonas ulvae TaxID=107327 RepID=UPI001D05498E
SAYEVVGQFDVTRAERALNEIMLRHEVLRTNFVSNDAGTFQVINEAASLSLETVDLRGHSDSADTIAALIGQEQSLAWDLSSDLMMRCQFIQTDEQEGVLMFNMHHIASDGWSMGILVEEFVTLYEAYGRGEESPLVALPIQYADYAVWQRNEESQAAQAQGLAYWEEQLAGLPPVHSMPLDYVRPAEQSSAGAYIERKVSQRVKEELQALALKHDCTLFMVLHAAFGALLSRHSGQSDIVLGTPVANRMQAEVAPLIGCFMNTLVLRSQCEATQSFTEHLSQVRDVNLAAQQHQSIPFEQLVERLQPERSTSYSPLFQIMFSMNTNDTSALTLSGATLTPRVEQQGSAMYELTLDVVQEDDGLVFHFEYNTDVFAACTIERLAARFEVMLRSILSGPEQPLGELEILPEDEQTYLLSGLNETASPYDTQLCVHEKLEWFASQTPDAIALVCGDEVLTY